MRQTLFIPAALLALACGGGPPEVPERAPGPPEPAGPKIVDSAPWGRGDLPDDAVVVESTANRLVFTTSDGSRVVPALVGWTPAPLPGDTELRRFEKGPHTLTIAGDLAPVPTTVTLTREPRATPVPFEEPVPPEASLTLPAPVTCLPPPHDTCVEPKFVGAKQDVWLCADGELFVCGGGVAQRTLVVRDREAGHENVAVLATLGRRALGADWLVVEGLAQPKRKASDSGVYVLYRDPADHLAALTLATVLRRDLDLKPHVVKSNLPFYGTLAVDVRQALTARPPPTPAAGAGLGPLVLKLPPDAPYTAAVVRCALSGASVKAPINAGAARVDGVPTGEDCELQFTGGMTAKVRPVRGGTSLTCRFDGTTASCEPLAP